MSLLCGRTEIGWTRLVISTSIYFFRLISKTRMVQIIIHQRFLHINWPYFFRALPTFDIPNGMLFRPQVTSRHGLFPPVAIIFFSKYGSDNLVSVLSGPFNPIASNYQLSVKPFSSRSTSTTADISSRRNITI